MDKQKGIIVTSAIPKAGKTLISSGIVASILASGLKLEAIKPLEYGLANNDLNYMMQITKQPRDFKPLLINNWTKSDKESWEHVVGSCQNLSIPALIEIPCTITTPISADYEVLDATDLSKTLDWPLLMIFNANELFFEQAVLALSYAKSKGVNILGFIVTCKKPNIDIDIINILAYKLTLNYPIACLGIIPYSPSVSVDEFRQGNIIRLTQENIDLLPIQTSLNLAIKL